MKDVNQHNFIMNLPSDPRDAEPSIRMDGELLHGVTGLTIRSGGNGYTNIVLQMECKASVRTAAALIHQLENEDEFFAGLFDEVAKEFPGLQGIDIDGCDKSRLIGRLLSLTIEQAGSL